jgi:hypothetical protein
LLLSKKKSTNAYENVEKKEPLYTAAGIATTSHYANDIEVSQKTKNADTI